MLGKLSLPVVEEMILLSRLIKSLVSYPVQSEKKVISIKRFDSTLPQEIQETEIDQTPIQLLEEAQKEAERIILSAKNEYENMVTAMHEEKLAWEQEKLSLIEEAKQTGYQAGWKEGERQGYDQYSSQIQEAKNVIHAAKKDYHAYLESSEQTIVDLSLSIAEKVVATRIEGDQEYFLSLVKKALKEVKSLPEVQILVHPSQYEFLLTKKNELQSIFTNDTNLLIYPDSDLTQGSCLIESTYGRIDASIDTQLLEVKKALTQCLEGMTS